MTTAEEHVFRRFRDAVIKAQEAAGRGAVKVKDAPFHVIAWDRGSVTLIMCDTGEGDAARDRLREVKVPCGVRKAIVSRAGARGVLQWEDIR